MKNAALMAAKALRSLGPIPMGQRVIADAELRWAKLVTEASNDQLGTRELTLLFEWLVDELKDVGSDERSMRLDVELLLTAAAGITQGAGMSWGTFEAFYVSIVENRILRDRDVASQAKVVTMSDARAIFDSLDQNASGYLDLDELRGLMQWCLSKISLDQSGPLGGDELANETATLLKQIDTNTDGRVSWLEFEVFWACRDQEVSHR